MKIKKILQTFTWR